MRQSIVNYTREMRYLFAHFNDQNPRIWYTKTWWATSICQSVHGWDVTNAVFAAAAVFYKHIFRTPLVATNCIPEKFRLRYSLSGASHSFVAEHQNPKHKLIIGRHRNAARRTLPLKWNTSTARVFRSKSWAAKATKTDSRFCQGATERNGNLLPTLPPYFF
jgi:hypothetical protein